jgi:histidinol dehydrogenase
MEAALLPTLSAAPIGAAFLESRVARDDGYLWPIERRKMQARGPIRERMVEDIIAAVREGGEAAVVTVADLHRLDWSFDQIESHARTAFAVYRAEHEPRRKRRTLGRRDSAAAMATDAAALVIFAIPALFWAGVLAGVL